MRRKTRSEACILVAALSAAVLLTSVSITFVEWTLPHEFRLAQNAHFTEH